MAKKQHQAHPNSPERQADAERRAMAGALANRVQTPFGAAWGRTLAHVPHLIDVGDAYAEWDDRGKPVISQYGKVSTGPGDPDKPLIERDEYLRARKAVKAECGRLGLALLDQATLQGKTASWLSETHLGLLSRKEMLDLGAVQSRQRLTALKRAYVVGRVQRCLEIVEKVKQHNDW